MKNTRELLLPSMIVTPAPWPAIVRSVLITSSPPVNVIVPAQTLIVSPGDALRIAERNELSLLTQLA
jgi:hypothetical protein